MGDAPGVLTSPTLLREVRNPDNNEPAWRKFMERYRPLIEGWCGRWELKDNDVEEITSAVLCKLVTALRTFVYDPKRSFRAWLKVVVDNAVKDFWRAKGQLSVCAMPEEVEAPGDVDDLVQELDGSLGRELQEARRIAEHVRGCVLPRRWQAYWLTAILNKPVPEVAQELGMTRGAVYQAKHVVSQMLYEEGKKVRKQSKELPTEASHDLLCQSH